MIKARYLCEHLTSSTKLCCLFELHRIQGSRRLADGGHSNRFQGATDIQIHLCHLLATSQEITSKSSLGESTPIYPAKYFYLHLYLYYNKNIHKHEKPNKDFVLIYIYMSFS